MSSPRIDQVGQAYGDAEALAVRAAHAGRVDELERKLREISVKDAIRAHDLGARLRRVAQCVRAHPSFRDGEAGPQLRVAGL